jgi:hypothetical protein
MPWPTSTQVLLLRAALLPPALAIPAWQDWKTRVDILRLDVDSDSFLSLLHANLQRCGVTSEWSELLKGNSRHLWIRNQLSWKTAGDLCLSLASMSPGFLMLGSHAAVATCYRDLGVRPLGAPRFLLPEPVPETACTFLGNTRGWQTALYPEFREEEAPDFWTAVRTVEFNGLSLRCLGPEDQFLWTCVEGYRRRTNTPLWWLADAAEILLAHPEFQWERLIQTASRRHWMLPLRHTLAFLQNRLGLDLPKKARHVPWPGAFEYGERALLSWPGKKSLPSWLMYARSTEKISYAGNSPFLRTFYFLVNRAWHRVRRRGPGWLRQTVKKLTRTIQFEAPWLLPGKK